MAFQRAYFACIQNTISVVTVCLHGEAVMLRLVLTSTVPWVSMQNTERGGAEGTQQFQNTLWLYLIKLSLIVTVKHFEVIVVFCIPYDNMVYGCPLVWTLVLHWLIEILLRVQNITIKMLKTDNM